MKNSKQNIKWVIKNKKTGLFFNSDNRYQYTRMLKNAQVFQSRSWARNAKFEDETVKKAITSGNIAVKVLD